jgi:predicted membrane-bound spermidine synthase
MVRVYGDENAAEPLSFGCGLSSVYETPYHFRLHLDIDGDASSPIIKFDGDFKKVEVFKYYGPSFVYHLSTASDVLIIGPGAGRDVLSALAFGSKNVKGVEINPVIVNDVMKGRFREYSGNLYLLDNVEIVIDDARSYIRNSQEKYDVIQASLVDTWAATNAGAYALSENILYTVEAFSEYMNHLRENGYLSIVRWEGDHSLRLMVLYRKAAEKIGIKNIGRHVIVVKTGPKVNHIFKKSEFSGSEIKKIMKLVDRMKFELLYVPDFFEMAPNLKMDDKYDQIINSKNLNEFIGSYPIDLRPSTDDSPFFFNKVRLRSIPDLLIGLFRHPGYFLLYGLFIVASLLTLVFIGIPMYLNRGEIFRRETKSKLLYLVYFSLLGMAFMVIEISFLQRFMLFLGHPTYSTMVVIFSFLLFAGIGSFISNGLKSHIKIILLMIVGVLVCYNLMLYSIFNLLLGLDIRIRILISILLLSIVGVLMGMPFPIGMRLLGFRYKELIPFCWSLNGVFSVLGSILSLILAMNIGFTKTIFVAITFYFVAYIVSFSFVKVSSE